MVRRYYRRRPANRDKYSVETTAITSPASSGWNDVIESQSTLATKQFSIAILPPSDIQGMRKVKHITLTFSSASDSILYYALVYVPAGYDPNFLSVAAAGQAISLYEPNQYVMSSGVLDFSGGPLRIRSPLARNLNSGDSIHLVIASPQQEPSTPPPTPLFAANVQYAITLQ